MKYHAGFQLQIGKRSQQEWKHAKKEETGSLKNFQSANQHTTQKICEVIENLKQ